MIQRRYLVSGRVQGVGFRAFVHRQANSLGLQGKVRNLIDGRVEILAAGEDSVIVSFENMIRRGPSLAFVTGIDTSEAASADLKNQGFTISEDGGDPWKF